MVNDMIVSENNEIVHTWESDLVVKPLGSPSFIADTHGPEDSLLNDSSPCVELLAGSVVTNFMNILLPKRPRTRIAEPM